MACFFFIASLTGYLLLHQLGPPACFKRTFLDIHFCITYIFGYFGARLTSMIVEGETISIGSLLASGSMTYYGGFIAGVSAAILYAKFCKISLLTLADISFPIGLICLGIGRIGCFLNGDDFGIVADLTVDGKSPWWAVTFPNHPVALPRFPVQLLESAIVLLLGSILLKMKMALGYATAISVGGYAIIRFFLEFLRDDQRGWWINGVLSTSQGISIAILILTSIIFTIRWQQHRQ